MNFDSAKVIVVGDVILDRYWQGQTSRISPEAPVPVVLIKNEDFRLGGASNVAYNIATLGAQAILVGLVGDDNNADLISGMLETVGVHDNLIRAQGHRTISKLRLLSQNQQLIRADFEDNFVTRDNRDLLARIRQNLSSVKVVVLSDYAKGTVSNSEEIIALASSFGAHVIVDPKGKCFEKYSGARLLTPNMSEFQAVVGPCESDAEIEDRAKKLCDHLDVGGLLVTRSEKGMSLIERNARPIHIRAQGKDIFDVTGAGDTVVATIGAALAAGISLPEAVTLSNAAAGIVIGKLGTAAVSREQLFASMDQTASGEVLCGICTKEQLLSEIRIEKENKRKIVFTNGCFDILHAGHVEYLEKARKLGDRLIVAVNCDASVKRLKGDTRPINSLMSRMSVLSALSCVDWVVPFSEDTPERLVEEVSPDALVKGGDYKIHDIVGAHHVTKSGGTVQTIAFKDGFSTTNLVNKIKRDAV